MSWKQPVVLFTQRIHQFFFLQRCLSISTEQFEQGQSQIFYWRTNALWKRIYYLLSHQSTMGKWVLFSFFLLNILIWKMSFFPLCLSTIVIRIIRFELSQLKWCVTVVSHITPASTIWVQTGSLFELMLSTCKMAGKVIFVFAHLATDIALEWVFIAVTSHVNGVQDVITKVNLTMLASV